MKKLLYGMQHHSRQENLVYGAMWTLLFAAPMLSLYIRTVNDSQLTFDWHEVFIVWRQYAAFLLLFLLHNYLLAPLLVYRQKKVLYFSAVACLMGLFVFYQCSNHPAARADDARAHGAAGAATAGANGAARTATARADGAARAATAGADGAARAATARADGAAGRHARRAA